MKDRLLKCAMWFVGMIRRASVASGIVHRTADAAKTLIRPNKNYFCAASASFTQPSNCCWWALIQPSTCP
ncbi:hypothetical protein GY518_002909 [Escherichia coli]|nr:hypothetical protein [Escherichia coli]EFC1807958.1 hypothetical protein [Escherichia coli]EFC6739668.1 hypothetical protein [Escherichia coli]EFI3675193.1 hypothetical protein [Escherichia coli]